MTYVYRRAEEIDREPVAPYVFREDIPHGTIKRPRRQDFNPGLCGTTKGYWQHRRYDQPQCPVCAEAYSAHQREYRQRKAKEGGKVGEGHPPLLHTDQRVPATPENQDAQ